MKNEELIDINEEIEETGEETGEEIGAHYKDSLLEPWDVMKDWFTPDEYIGFLKGCILKRIKRWKEEDGPRDLEKMQQEIKELINFVVDQFR